jgi:hypothetical protein
MVYNFNYEKQKWEFMQKIATPASVTGDRVGHSVSISGKYLVVGSPYNSQFGNHTGNIYIYQQASEDSDSFTASDTRYSPIPSLNADFGWSVDVNSKGVIAVGAKGDRGTVGSVYIFKTSSVTTWTHVFTIAPTDSTASSSTGGNFGWAVAIDEE